MKKEKLVLGKRYVRRHKAPVYSRFGKVKREAAGDIKCAELTKGGAVFLLGDGILELTNKEIEKEVFECEERE